MQNLYRISFNEIWNYLRSETLSFWLICIYLFFEYVRPQTIYPVIDVVPYAQIVILSALGVSLMRGELFQVRNPVNRLIVLFFVVIILSTVTAYIPKQAYDNWYQYISWMIVFFLIVNIVNTENRFLVFLLSFLIYNFKMAQFSFRNWVLSGLSFSSIGTGGGPGWFQNSGEFGIEMCVFFPLAACFVLALRSNWQRWKKALFWLLPVTALSGMVSSSSRGALLGCAAILIWFLAKSKLKIKGLLVLAIIGMFIFIVTPEEQVQRLTMAGKDVTSQTRLNHWKYGLEIINDNPILGVGYFNWLPYYNDYYGGRELSHNIFIQCASELGYVGLTIFILMVFWSFLLNHRTRKVAREKLKGNRFISFMAHGLDGALVGYLVSGFFVTVLYYPYFWINIALTVALYNTACSEAAAQHQESAKMMSSNSCGMARTY